MRQNLRSQPRRAGPRLQLTQSHFSHLTISGWPLRGPASVRPVTHARIELRRMPSLLELDLVAARRRAAGRARDPKDSTLGGPAESCRISRRAGAAISSRRLHPCTMAAG
eukprot:1769246-Prymnesium_polylepis.1